MTDAILVAYATTHGSTREVAEAVAETLRERDLAVEVRPAADVRNLHGYGGIVLGGALYTGRWHRDARRFLKRHAGALAKRPLAVWAMGPGTLAEDEVAKARTQLDRALSKRPGVHPLDVAIFGGVVDPTVLRFPFNRMAPSDARDWPAIKAWARSLADRFVSWS